MHARLRTSRFLSKTAPAGRPPVARCPREAALHLGGATCKGDDRLGHGRPPLCIVEVELYTGGAALTIAQWATCHKGRQSLHEGSGRKGN
ncbi:hypothetical protein B296_00032992 [Ensete ventricosum]|uniref:Uncharacterized protein n=1 Tax=Ensete ventricosum TaxID=4639 RepID=A0A427AC77_ENSVE|nr:hypothetical protein B296_00032992 [Ensete ventricosum]